MTNPLNSPEFALLVAATARPPLEHHRAAIAAAAEPGRIDWPHFLKLIDRHRVAPLVFDALSGLRGAIPDNFFGEMRAKAMRDRTQALQTIGVLGIVQTRLADAGIEAVSIKGPTLAQLAFGDPTLRQCRDLDVLIPPGRVEDALHALQAAGFRLVEPHGVDAPGRLAVWVRLMKDLSLLHERTGTLVELHWRLSNNPHLLLRTVSSSRQSVELGSIDAVTLGSDDLLLYLCVHGAKHLWFRLKWLADIYALLAAAGPDRIEDFVSDADRRGASKSVRQTLDLLAVIYGLSIWQDRPRDTTLLTRWAIDALRWENEPTERRFGNFKIQLAQMQLRTNLRYIAYEIMHLSVDWPMVVKRGGRRSGYVIAVTGRPILWALRKLRLRK